MDDTKRERLPSGRFVLRIAPELHQVLRTGAAAAGMSLNEYCARKLALPGPGASAAALRTVERAVAVAGRALTGVIAYGSWARGELAEASDVDVLVTVAGELAVTRDLYRVWDREPVWWDGHVVEPHFVHLPDPDSGSVSGTWAEAAVEGIVLFERGLEVTKRLAAIRARIAEGRLVRRRVHGQPYWVEAA